MTPNKPEKRILGLTPSLLGIILLGAVLRFLKLGGQSVWIDEGFSWMASKLSFSNLTALSWEDVHPPLYYYLLKISLGVLPDTEFGLRFVSALCSIATVAVMTRFVYRHWGQRSAVYVGLLAALSPFDIYYAQEARMYALLSFLFVLAFTELVETLEGKPAHLFGWVAANIGLAWTHAYGLLAVFLQLGFFVAYCGWLRFHGRPLPLKNGTLFVAFVVGLLGVTPVVIFFWMIRGNASTSVLLPETNRLLYIIRCWATGPMHAFPAFKIPWRLHDVAAIVMVGCALLGVRQLWKRSEFYRWILAFATVLIVFPAAIIYTYSILTKHAMWIDRGFLGSAHMLYLFAGVGLAAVESRALRGLAAVAIGVSLVSGEIYYYTRFEKSFAAAAFHSLPSLTPQQALLLTPPWLNNEAYYYFRDYRPLWGVSLTTPFTLLRITRPPERVPFDKPVPCDPVAWTAISEMYVFGESSTIRANHNQWPDCLLGKKIWVFEDSHWQPLDK